MKLIKVKIENFRSYCNEVEVDINDLTTFVGKNDVGKSTILEALDIFFNEGKGIIRIDKDDISKTEENKNDMKITAVFDELPNSITIDDTNPTNLKDEYLLNSNNYLEIIKKYPNAGGEKVFIKAHHPTNKDCQDLLSKKIAELKKIYNNLPLQKTPDNRRSAEIRKAIWNYYDQDLQLQEIEIDTSKEDAKNIWIKIKEYVPLFALFQSDRKNSDGDSEIQNPMKLAVNEILKDEHLSKTLNEVADDIKKKLETVANSTLEKLKEMNPDIAKTLSPVIPSSESLKWADVFKNVSITGDENIPINKRGSGVKRLVLLNFFRAEAERRSREGKAKNIIYAIEEPETSQHQQHQRKLIGAFIKLSQSGNTQILLTTHSPLIVKLLEFDDIRLIKNDPHKKVVEIKKSDLPYPSLNEVNYLAFGEADEEYHNELYGYIEFKGNIEDFKKLSSHEKRQYIEVKKNGDIKPAVEKILSEYIRHQIHHPENTENERFTYQDLQSSITAMRNFINKK